MSGTGNTTGGTTGNPPSDPISGTPVPTGTNDLVVATASVGGVFSVVVGATQTISITFTSSDGNAITGFGVTSSGALPDGWSGPASFTCASVSAGSGCVLNLTYAPTATATGTLTIDYVFVDNATMPSTGGSLTIAYAATAADNVDAAAAPTGEVNSAVGGNRSVSVNFTTDDGQAATNLAVTTNLAALPPGWSTDAGTFGCAIVSTGSGCLLPLTFAPTTGVRGLLTLSYGYTDDSGNAKTGAVNIPYSTSSQNTVVGTASPSGEIIAVQKGGGQAVTVNFTTDDGKPASALFVTSDLTALAPGWSSAESGLTCASVSTGNGCQLHLTYAPTALTTGTLVLTYAYTDGGGAARTGSLDVPYAATTDDNAVATASPSGQINAVVGAGAQPVSVTFTTDDGRPATALELTTPLSTLPAGWSSTASSLTCSGFGGGTGCQLPLVYMPTAAAAGTLTLNYAYKNNAGKPRTGSVNIAYRATTHDNIAGTPNPAAVAAVAGTSTPVTITFVTDDGNPASVLAVTSGLAALPAGWSAAPTFACATVSAGSGCVLSLTYAPVAADSGTLSLTFSYDDDSGTPKTGSVSIAYRATTNDNVVATPSPASVAVAVNSATPVTVTFTTDDGNPASALTVTSNLSTLPDGWSSAAPAFACAAVSTGNGCALNLTYAPAAAAAGTLVIAFSYDDNSGTPKTGSVSIPYSAM